MHERGPVYRHTGKTSKKDGVTFKQGHLYISLHVYKPQASQDVPGGVAFKWDSGPANGVSAWAVDAESIFFFER